MQIRIIKQTVAAGSVVRIDDVINVDDKEGRFLIHLGRAVEHAGAVEAKIETPAEIEAEETPKPAKKKKGS